MKIIKSIVTNTAYVNLDGIVEYEFVGNIANYDNQGRITEDSVFDQKNELESKATFAYDANGHLSEETTFVAEDQITDSKHYTNSEDGKILRVEIHYGDGTISSQFAEYGKDKSVLTTYDENGDFDGSETQLFNSAGKIIEMQKLDEEKVVEHRILFQYDDDQNLITTVEYDRDGDIRMRRKFEYDSKSRRVKEAGYNAKGEVAYSRSYIYNDLDQLEKETNDDYTTVYEYDETGKDLRHLLYNNEQIESIQLFKYNDDGLLVEEIVVQSGVTYTLTPTLLGEANTNYLSKKYIYEFYE